MDSGQAVFGSELTDLDAVDWSRVRIVCRLLEIGLEMRAARENAPALMEKFDAWLEASIRLGSTEFDIALRMIFDSFMSVDMTHGVERKNEPETLIVVEKYPK